VTSRLSLGVLGTSTKENERRLPIHPAHIERIDSDLRSAMYLEQGYGERFGVRDEQLAPQVAGMFTREELIATTDVVLLPKPTLDDVRQLHDGQVLWGWPHCVQDAELTQIAIDKRLTVIAWEAMNHWTPSGSFAVHVFHVNNELAGYASVMHALTLMGSTGHYGRQLRAAVIGFGNTARGAINALQSMGIHEVTVLTMRDVTAVASPIPSAVLDHLDRVPGTDRTDLDVDGVRVPTAAFLASNDVVVNCVLQDTDQPMTFVDDHEIAGFTPGSLIVDVSSDLGMGFTFARPTTFDSPTFEVGDGVTYYGVDHSPSYYWNSATWSISEALMPYLHSVMGGTDWWEKDDTIRQAIEIRDGNIQNKKILSFQHRSADYPHPRIDDA
jgi:alanine dehydrogenase